MDAIYVEWSLSETRIAVGPSAAPMIAMDAASLMGKNKEATIRVRNTPPCPAAPTNISQGFSNSGPKSIIAPIPINNRRGNTSYRSIPNS